MNNHISAAEYNKMGGHAGRRRKAPVQREHHEQVALFVWVDREARRRPELKMLFAIPNGGQRSPRTAGMLKAEGVKAGVPDLCFPVARGQYHGLFIELKAEGGKATESQQSWISALAAQGYCARLCVGCEAAKLTLMAYLDGRIESSTLFIDEPDKNY